MRHFYLLFFRNNWIICHTLKVFVSRYSWIMSVAGISLFVKAWIMVLRPLWFLTFDPSPIFSAIFLSNELSLFWPTADFLSQGLEDSCFDVKWSLAFVHICWSFLRRRIVCRQQQDPFHSHDFGKAGNVSNIHSQLLRKTAKAGKNRCEFSHLWKKILSWFWFVVRYFLLV